MSLVKELLRSWLLYEVRGEEIFGEQLPWVFESFGGREMVGVWLYRNILACASCIIFLEYGGYGPMADSVIPLLNCFGFADCFFCPNILLIYKSCFSWFDVLLIVHFLTYAKNIEENMLHLQIIGGIFCAFCMLKTCLCCVPFIGIFTLDKHALWFREWLLLNFIF